MQVFLEVIIEELSGPRLLKEMVMRVEHPEGEVVQTYRPFRIAFCSLEHLGLEGFLSFLLNTHFGLFQDSLYLANTLAPALVKGLLGLLSEL